jgi:hypothetical protein
VNITLTIEISGWTTWEGFVKLKEPAIGSPVEGSLATPPVKLESASVWKAFRGEAVGADVIIGWLAVIAIPVSRGIVTAISPVFIA